jgi:hypothetical protein
MNHGNTLQESMTVEQSFNSKTNVGNSCAEFNIDFVLKGGWSSIIHQLLTIYH